MKHLAIIADGNRRWAKNNNLPSQLGYNQGLITIERCCSWAIDNSISCLTVYCFSTENWSRPINEVNYLMDLGRWYFEDKRNWYIAKDIKVQFTGRKDRIPLDLLQKCEILQEATKNGKTLILNICLDYGGRDEIIQAINAGMKTEEEISLFISHGIPDPDAILRTGGEKRLSNFLLWQSAYSELFFIPTLFPDLSFTELDNLLNEYNQRQRNFGA